MNLDTPYGSKVRFTNRGGFPWQQEAAIAKGLVHVEIYTTKCMHIGQCSSVVDFTEIDGTYNTTMFENVECVTQTYDRETNMMVGVYERVVEEDPKVVYSRFLDDYCYINVPRK